MPADKEENMFRKIADAVGLAADLATGAVLVIVGVAVIVGGATGTLWY